MSVLGLTSSRHNDAASDPAKYDHQILLVDHTETADGEREQEVAPTASADSGSLTPLSSHPSKRLNRASLREDLAKRGLVKQKYARWQQNRYLGVEDGSGSAEVVQIDSKQARADADEADQNTEENSIREGRVERVQSKLSKGKQKVKGLVKSKPSLKKEKDAVVDVLYENQRGSFFFGIPLFSSKSLLNFDPAPWVNGQFKISPVNITNASVPDPSWEWAWKSWYVDMSHDVDEEGWQYSFSFHQGFAWHGNHPWFHSFVRRRRWLRKRVRKHTIRAGTNIVPEHLSAAHMLNEDYFTIHPKAARARSPDSSADASLARSLSFSRRQAADEESEEAPDITDIPTLMLRLKKAAIDREKIVIVRNFLENGAEELYYLPEQIPTIMSLFVFQSSRRQLLSLLLQTCDAASAHRRAHAEDNEPEGPEESRKIDNLLRAVKAANEACRRLEYWSDLQGVSIEEAAEEKRNGDWLHGGDLCQHDSDSEERMSNGNDEAPPMSPEANGDGIEDHVQSQPVSPPLKQPPRDANAFAKETDKGKGKEQPRCSPKDAVADDFDQADLDLEPVSRQRSWIEQAFW
ncbi:hypothetical protein JOL62DRAFT_109956 [Phyllosticta paracitricarpa]|uniref:Peroxin/Ferlin domain-containing protein n=1 Tax=Phyllosticta paracitricarpa TaxID=2016321 RepID=A0ABR1N9I5_9PEZI